MTQHFAFCCNCIFKIPQEKMGSRRKTLSFMEFKPHIGTLFECSSKNHCFSTLFGITYSTSPSSNTFPFYLPSLVTIFCGLISFTEFQSYYAQMPAFFACSFKTAQQQAVLFWGGKCNNNAFSCGKSSFIIKQ